MHWSRLIKKLKLKRMVEYSIVLVAAFIFWVFLSKIPGREIHTDVIWYANMGFNNIADARWMARYTHVFLLKPFVHLINNPINAIISYWAFVISVTCTLIYYCARKLTEKNHIIHGLLAVLIFLIFPAHRDHAGVGLNDITSMLFVMIILTIYLISSSQEHNKPSLLVLLGFFIFLALNVKETTWISLVLVPGVGFQNGNGFRKEIFIRRLVFIGSGFLIGFALFTVLFGVFLGDSLFQFRILNLRYYFGFWLIESPYYSINADWFTNNIWLDFPIPFLLFIVSGIILSHQNDSIHLRIMWMIPLLLVGFLTIGLTKNMYDVFPRLLYPAYAVISVFAPNIVNANSNFGNKKRLQFWILLGFGLVLLYGFEKLSQTFTQIVGMDHSIFVMNIYIPAFLTILLVSLVWRNRNKLTINLVTLLSMIAILKPLLLLNYWGVIEPTSNGIAQIRFYPLIEFTEEMEFEQEDKAFISRGISTKYKYSYDRVLVSSIFNLFFRVNTTRNNFLVDAPHNDIEKHILNDEYEYYLLTENEWISLTSKQSTLENIESRCQHVLGSEPIVLINCE